MSVELGTAGAGLGVDAASAPGPLWDRPYRPTWVTAINGVGGVLRRVGLSWPRLDVEGLLAVAERRAGLSDWGDDRFRSGLEILVEAFEGQEDVHTFGRLFFREYCLRLLINRLKIQDDLKRFPEILEVPIRRPLFITGLPRSGTTLLHRLMSQDPEGRPLLFWETIEPSPPPRRETYRTDPRIARVRRMLKTLYALAPRIPAAHSFEAESPEECNYLFAHGFVAGFNGFLFDVADYTKWLDRQDLVEPYRYLRRQLQLLSWRCPGDHWVLKAPAHLYGLDALLNVFPDACIVQTHRDPRRVMPSLCSLAYAFRGIVSDRVNLRRLGAEFTEAMSVGPERAIAVRESADPARFYDVAYPDLVADPVCTVREVCRHFGYDFDSEYEERTRRWLVANPRNKLGVHRYTLEQFGLDTDTVDRHFAKYREWVEVHVNRPI